MLHATRGIPLCCHGCKRLEIINTTVTTDLSSCSQQSFFITSEKNKLVDRRRENWIPNNKCHQKQQTTHDGIFNSTTEDFLTQMYTTPNWCHSADFFKNQNAELEKKNELVISSGMQSRVFWIFSDWVINRRPQNVLFHLKPFLHRALTCIISLSYASNVTQNTPPGGRDRTPKCCAVHTEYRGVLLTGEWNSKLTALVSVGSHPL
jgi:hypothetical protein